VQFGGCDESVANCSPIVAGSNYMVRMYLPRAEILSGAWVFPPRRPLPEPTATPPQDCQLTDRDETLPALDDIREDAKPFQRHQRTTVVHRLTSPSRAALTASASRTRAGMTRECRVVETGDGVLAV